MSDYQVEKKRREVQIRTQVTQKLEDSGEREKLKEVLRSRLRECGWRDQLKEHCRGVISQKGLSNVTVDGLVKEITPKARSTVPDAVKKELLQHIRDYLEKQT